MKKLILVLISSLAFTSILPANATAPAAATVDGIRSTSTSTTLHDQATAVVSGSKSAGLMSYTVTATSLNKPTVKVTVTPPSSSIAWEVPLTGLIGGSIYTIVVTTTNSGGSTDVTLGSQFIAKSLPAAPTLPQENPVVAGIGKATLTWIPQDPGGLTLTKYVISAGGKTWDVNDVTATNFEVTGLNPGQNAVFSIVAVNALGNSPATIYNSVRIPSAPGKVAGVDAVLQSDGSVKVTWTAPTDDGGSTVTGYSVSLAPQNGAELAATVKATTQAVFANVGAGTWTAKVSATNLAGTGLQVSDPSPLTIAAPPSPLTLTPTPTISGSAIVGQSLTAVPGTWDSGVTFAYQWNQDGNPISGANASSYVLTNLVLGSVISVSITGSKSGFASTTKTSLNTVAVVAAQSNSNQNQNTPPPPPVVAPQAPTPTPTPTPTPSVTPTPTASATPSATPTPSSTPTPSATPSVTATPSPTSTAEAAVKSTLPAKTIPANTSVSAVAATVKPSSVVTVTSSDSSKTTSIKKNATIALTLPSVPKGTTVKQVLVGPDGKSYTLVSGKTTSSGQVSTPTLKFAKAGTYTLTMTIGTKKKVVKIVVK